MLRVGFFLFFIGRVIGAATLRKTPAQGALGTDALINVLRCGLMAKKVG